MTIDLTSSLPTSLAGYPGVPMVPVPVQAMGPSMQALLARRSISVMTGSFVDDFMTAAPTICMSTMDDFVTAVPTTIGDLESSAPTLVHDLANPDDFEFEDSDTAAEETEEDTELLFESDSSSCSSADSSEGYPALPLHPALPPLPPVGGVA